MTMPIKNSVTQLSSNLRAFYNVTTLFFGWVVGDWVGGVALQSVLQPYTLSMHVACKPCLVGITKNVCAQTKVGTYT